MELRLRKRINNLPKFDGGKPSWLFSNPGLSYELPPEKWHDWSKDNGSLILDSHGFAHGLEDDGGPREAFTDPNWIINLTRQSLLALDDTNDLPVGHYYINYGKGWDYQGSPQARADLISQTLLNYAKLYGTPLREYVPTQLPQTAPKPIQQPVEVLPKPTVVHSKSFRRPQQTNPYYVETHYLDQQEPVYHNPPIDLPYYEEPAAIKPQVIFKPNYSNEIVNNTSPYGLFLQGLQNGSLNLLDVTQQPANAGTNILMRTNKPLLFNYVEQKQPQITPKPIQRKPMQKDADGDVIGGDLETVISTGKARKWTKLGYESKAAYDAAMAVKYGSSETGKRANTMMKGLLIGAIVGGAANLAQNYIGQLSAVKSTEELMANAGTQNRSIDGVGYTRQNYANDSLIMSSLNKSGLSSTLSGVASGAAAGASFGWIGAAAGAVIGGLTGALGWGTSTTAQRKRLNNARQLTGRINTGNQAGAMTTALQQNYYSQNGNTGGVLYT